MMCRAAGPSVALRVSMEGRHYRSGKTMFRIKICGITSIDDARTAAEAGADAVGLNFFAGSPRHLPPEHARDVVESLPAGVVKVGLFVNAPSDEVCHKYDLLGLDLIQLHGDEPPDFLPALGGRPVMRAFRLTQSGLAPVAAYLDACRRLHCLPQLVLIDAFSKGQYGGTGQTADWNLAARYREEIAPPPWVLAGGLTAANVAEAIRIVRPMAVDTASGVESRPGCKDRALTRRFVEAAKAAFGS